jgi:hypothetical protein
VADDEEQAIQAVKRLGELDRGRMRVGFEKRFAAGRMAVEYVSLPIGDEWRIRRIPRTRLACGCRERGSCHLNRRMKAEAVTRKPRIRSTG